MGIFDDYDNKPKLKFRTWWWFIPAFGLLYLVWYGIMTTTKYVPDLEGGFPNLVDWHPLAYLGFIFYAFIHIYGTAIFIAWMLSIFGVI